MLISSLKEVFLSYFKVLGKTLPLLFLKVFTFDFVFGVVHIPVSPNMRNFYYYVFLHEWSNLRTGITSLFLRSEHFLLAFYIDLD